jgi:hypothetical protein
MKFKAVQVDKESTGFGIIRVTDIEADNIPKAYDKVWESVSDKDWIRFNSLNIGDKEGRSIVILHEKDDMYKFVSEVSSYLYEFVPTDTKSVNDWENWIIFMLDRFSVWFSD